MVHPQADGPALYKFAKRGNKQHSCVASASVLLQLLSVLNYGSISQINPFPQAVFRQGVIPQQEKAN